MLRLPLHVPPCITDTICGEGVVPRRVLTPDHLTAMTSSTIDLFTPAPGTVFSYMGAFCLRAVRYDGDVLICNGTEEIAHQVFAVQADDRADLSLFRVLENA